MAKRASIEGITIQPQPDLAAELGFDIEQARSRKDFLAIYDRLGRMALSYASRPNAKPMLDAIEVARRCVADAAKSYKDFLDEDLIKDLEGRFEAEQAKLLDFLSGILSPEQMERLREHLAEPTE